MKASCPLHKSHEKKKRIPQKKLDRILELGEVLTIKEIAGRLKLSEKDVFRVLREHDIM
jgi:phage antirepressor YoqD-like protein